MICFSRNYSCRKCAYQYPTKSTKTDPIVARRVKHSYFRNITHQCQLLSLTENGISYTILLSHYDTISMCPSILQTLSRISHGEQK
jgi:hypothetical protein